MSTLDVPLGIRLAPRLRVGMPMLVKLLFAADLMLAALYVATLEISRYRTLHFTARLFDLDREANLPVWFSSMQLFGAAVLSGVFAWCFVSRRDRRSWVLLLPPALFLFLSLDEVATIHEWLGNKFEAAVPSLARRNHSFARTVLWMFVLGPPLLLTAWAIGRRAWSYLRGRN